MIDLPPSEIPPKTICAALFSPLTLISRLRFWPRMIETRGLAGPWTFGQLGLATWRRPGSEKQWGWGPSSCWPSLWKPPRNRALQTKQVCPGASPFSWRESFPKTSLCKAQSSVLVLVWKRNDVAKEQHVSLPVLTRIVPVEVKRHWINLDFLQIREC